MRQGSHHRMSVDQPVRSLAAERSGRRGVAVGVATRTNLHTFGTQAMS